MTPSQFAEAVRQACAEAAVAAYEAAGSRGLCAEGRWEAALGALRSAELDELIRAFESAAQAKTP